jgi:hypothetical protein
VSERVVARMSLEPTAEPLSLENKNVPRSVVEELYYQLGVGSAQTAPCPAINTVSVNTAVVAIRCGMFAALPETSLLGRSPQGARVPRG